MDNKTHHSSGDSTSTTTTSSSNNSNNRDQYLKHLNKISHKISKPITRKPSSDHHHHHHPPPPPPPLPAEQNQPHQNQNQNQNQNHNHNQHQHQHQHQPPVYNINKSDFRDVVQRLTGSPAHESRLSTPPPIQPPKPPSSRLQRIRPPPLAQISNRPPPLLRYAAHPQQPHVNGQRGPHAHPLSPLPPFPAVHAAAESPISAYMRYIAQSQPLPPQPENIPPPAATVAQPQFGMPSSPLPFGCFPSPRSPYPLLSPNLLFSPTTMGQLGFQQFPISPRLPMPNPGWKDL